MNDVIHLSPFCVSMSLIVVWIFLWLAAYILNWGYSWINDCPIADRNVYVQYLMGRHGYEATKENSSYLYIQECWDDRRERLLSVKYSDAGEMIMVHFGILFCLPFFITFVYYNWMVSFIILGFIGVMHLARFSIRLNKKLKSHMDDEEVHEKRKL